MSEPTTHEILTYWLGKSAKSPKKAFARHAIWYRGGPKVDQEIRVRFLVRLDQARADLLAGWKNSSDGALALVVLLDQFTRNLFRGTPEAYSGDKLAQQIATHAVNAGHDKELSIPGRIFLYHPFHHSEARSEQNRAVSLLETLASEAPAAWRPYVQRSIKGFSGHRDVVRRFGRFPHRNQVLRRQNTAEESAYLESDPNTYGQSKT